jgi:hypothetical protein
LNDVPRDIDDPFAHAGRPLARPSLPAPVSTFLTLAIVALTLGAAILALFA